MAFLVLFAFVFVVVIAHSAAKQKRRRDLIQKVTSRFRVDELYVSADDLSLMGINFQEQTLVLGTDRRQAEYRFSQIASVEVLQNGVTVTQTNRGSQLLGTLAGGLALGGVGALVGGLSGSTRAREKVKGISIKVIVDDNTCPFYVVTFFKDGSKTGSDKGSILLKPAIQKADRTHAHLVNAIRQANATANQPSIVVVDTASLQKLGEMRSVGLLTDEEFGEQKRLLLGSSKSLAQNGRHINLPDSSLRTITLVDCDNKLKALNALKRCNPQLNSRSARQMISSLPQTLGTGISQEAAERMRITLVAAGMSVRMTASPPSN